MMRRIAAALPWILATTVDGAPPRAIAVFETGLFQTVWSEMPDRPLADRRPQRSVACVRTSPPAKGITVGSVGRWGVAPKKARVPPYSLMDFNGNSKAFTLVPYLDTDYFDLVWGEPDRLGA